MEYLPTVNRILKKPAILVIVPIGYLFVLIFAKWQLALPFDALWFFLGGLVGMYILDIAEEFFRLSPSPFRSMVFVFGVSLLGIYVLSSTREFAAKGVVLTIGLTLFLFQISEWKIRSNLSSWYRLFFGSVSERNQKIGIGIFCVVFVIESLLFLSS